MMDLRLFLIRAWYWIGTVLDKLTELMSLLAAQSVRATLSRDDLHTHAFAFIHVLDQ